MSAQIPYSISIFRDKKRKELHKKFEIDTHNDQPRQIIESVYKELTEKEKVNLDLIKFVAENLSEAKFNDVVREIFYCNDYKEPDIQITKITDLLEKCDLDPDSDVYFNCDFKMYNSIKIDSETNLVLLGKQLEILILELKKKSESYLGYNCDEEISSIFSQDFEQMSDLNYGYCQSESVLFDILAFIQYAISYIKNNPNSEIYYTVENYDGAYSSKDAYEMLDRYFI